jgi:hypothetical protein
MVCELKVEKQILIRQESGLKFSDEATKFQIVVNDAQFFNTV